VHLYTLHGRRGLGVLGLLLALPLAWVWGQARLSGALPPSAGGTLVRLVQPNIAQSDKWRGDNAREIFDELLALSTQGEGPRPAVIIWPESSVPFMLDESTEALQRIAEALEPGQTLVAGSIRRDVASCAGCTDRYFTSILVIDDTGQVTGRYDKWRLVPGGEYLPLAGLLEPLGFRKVVSLPESFEAGTGPALLQVPGLGQVAMLVCYEAIFPHRLLPEGAKPDGIINVTNDGWFGKSVGPWQHFAQVRLRATEQGIPVLRAANTGISAFVDSHGRVTAATTLGIQAVLESRFSQNVTTTLYSSVGDFALLAMILAVLAISSLFAYLLGKSIRNK
jgi:apolipoprotein N-acyltransferase